jgi:hypothetical protein
MKKLLILSLAILAVSCGQENETLYKGTVIDKHHVDPITSYRSESPEMFQIFMREDITQQVIKIHTNVPTYYNLEKGSRVSFRLSNYEMYSLGNTTDPTVNLYGK